MTTRAFNVLSSDGTATYTVIVEWNGVDLRVVCDCKAGALGDWCRHKNALLNGDEAILVARENLTDLLQWVKASQVHMALLEIHAAETQYREAEDTFKMAKAKVLSAKRAAASLVSSNRKI